MISKYIRSLLITSLILVIFCQFSSGQEQSSCKVLKKEISGSYQGGCKNGLAEGNGMASGEDMYLGSFKKGLPEGKGVYKYKDGPTYTGSWKKGLRDGDGELKYLVNGKDSVITGIWKADKYTGSVKTADDFTITNQTNIEYYSIKRSDLDRNLTEISFERVMQKYIPKDLQFTFSSGHSTKDGVAISLRDYTCPVYCYIHFTIKTSGGTMECNLDFIILKPGKYVVHITNN